MTELVPAPPPRDARQRRYPVRLIAQACRMYDGGRGWTPTEIRGWIAANFDGPTPALDSVRRWVIPSQAEEQRAQNRASAAARRARSGKPMLRSGRLDGAELDARMLELRAHGLTYATIATVVSLYHGSTLTGEQIRYRLRMLGVAPQQRKSEALHRMWAERRAAAPTADREAMVA
jgi:hypothetical protein